MRTRKTSLLFGLLAALWWASAVTPAAAETSLPNEKQCNKNKSSDVVTAGWCMAIVRRKGNCLACHSVVIKGPWPESLAPGGNIAPPLVGMKARFPDKDKLRAQIWDATQANPHSVMPPFGKHQLLSDSEIDAIVEWLQTI